MTAGAHFGAPTKSAQPAARKAGRRGLTGLVRFLVFVVGAGVLALLVRSAGPRAVYDVMIQAGPWLPIVMAFEGALIASDVLAMRALLGDAARDVPQRAWIRSSTLAYASAILLPAGRASGEAVRTTTLAPFVGAARAAGTCTRLQACVLIANAIASIVAAAVAARFSGPLAIALVINGVACGVLGAVILALTRSERLAKWLEKRFARFVAAHAASRQAPPPPGATRRALLRSLGGRVAQTFQYALAIYAVGVAATPVTAVLAQGIHLVGAALGDLVPNQMGVTEGAYRAFAGALHLADEPARALSIALVARVAQLMLAAICLAWGSALKASPPPTDA